MNLIMNRDSTAMYDPFLSNMMRRLSEIEPIRNSPRTVQCQSSSVNQSSLLPQQLQQPQQEPSSSSSSPKSTSPRTSNSPVEAYYSQSNWTEPSPLPPFDSMMSNNKYGQTPSNPMPNDQQQQQLQSSALQSKQPVLARPALSPYSVFVGRGNAAKNAVGNRRLTVLAKTKLAEYAKAETKNQKTEIVSSLLNTVRGAGGSFVKVINGKIQETNEHAAREKIGALLRDMLGEKYRSSSKAKVMKRQKLRKEKRQGGGSSSNEQEQQMATLSERHQIQANNQGQVQAFPRPLDQCVQDQVAIATNNKTDRHPPERIIPDGFIAALEPTPIGVVQPQQPQSCNFDKDSSTTAKGESSSSSSAFSKNDIVQL